MTHDQRVLTVLGRPDVVLAAPTAADVDVVTRHCQDPDVRAWTAIPVPYSTAEALAFIESVERGAVDGSAWTWGIRESGRLVGMIGLEVQAHASAEIGYWLAREARGRGLMDLAVAAVVGHAFDAAGLGLDRLSWQAYVGNWPSRRVAERAGFTIEGTVRGHAPQRKTRRDAWIGSLLREDWTAAATPTSTQRVLWRGLDEWRTEHADVTFADGRLVASGTQVGAVPAPFRVDYRLWTGPSYVTRRLDLVSTGQQWRRRLSLRRSADGSWSCAADGEGSPDLPPPGGGMAALRGCLDCDLAGSPLTNSMPILRHGLHRGPGSADLRMAWVSLPDLGVHLSPQRYEHVRADDDGGGAVRYIGDSGRFVRELTVSPDGLVASYPGLAELVGSVNRRRRSPAEGRTGEHV